MTACEPSELAENNQLDDRGVKSEASMVSHLPGIASSKCGEQGLSCHRPPQNWKGGKVSVQFENPCSFCLGGLIILLGLINLPSTQCVSVLERCQLLKRVRRGQPLELELCQIDAAILDRHPFQLEPAGLLARIGGKGLSRYPRCAARRDGTAATKELRVEQTGCNPAGPRRRTRFNSLRRARCGRRSPWRRSPCRPRSARRA